MSIISQFGLYGSDLYHAGELVDANKKNCLRRTGMLNSVMSCSVMSCSVLFSSALFCSALFYFLLIFLYVTEWDNVS